MSAEGAAHVYVGPWDELRAAATEVRFAVFVREQGIPARIELDEHDPGALHAVALDASGAAIGTGRLLPDGRIGRMAVLLHARGAGIGAAILLALVERAAARGDHEVSLHAQRSAVGFYRRNGFETVGEEYEEAGIPHQTMVLGLG